MLLLAKKDVELEKTKKDVEIEKTKKDVEIEKTKIKFMEEKIENCEKSVATNKTYVTHMATTTKFLLKKFGNSAPPLDKLTIEEATNLLKYDTYQKKKANKKIKALEMDKNYNAEIEAINIAKIISNKIENKSITDWICMKVLQKYKKNKVEKQSLWNTDKSRLHFVIKELIRDEIDEVEEEIKEVKKVTKKVAKKVTKKVTKKVADIDSEEIDDRDCYDSHDESTSGFWKEDPQGVKVIEFVIRPILEVVEKMLLVGMTKLTDKIKKNIAKTDEIETLGEISVSHRDFKKIVVDKSLEKKMLTKIAAELYLTKKPENTAV